MNINMEEFSMEHCLYENPSWSSIPASEFVIKYKTWLDDLMAERLADSQLDAWEAQQQIQEC